MDSTSCPATAKEFKRDIVALTGIDMSVVLQTIKPRVKYKCTFNGDDYHGWGKDFRFELENESTAFVFKPRHPRRGRRMYATEFFFMFTVDMNSVNAKTGDGLEKKWHASLVKAQKYLEESGWWHKDIYPSIVAAQAVSVDDAEAVMHECFHYSDPAESPLLHGKYADIATDLLACGDAIFQILNPKSFKVQKMNFGYPELNLGVLSDIKLAVREESEYIRSLRYYETGSCDISFHYDPAKQKAWYCRCPQKRKAHCYLALNSEYAMYYMDD